MPKRTTLLPCEHQFEQVIFRKSVVLEGASRSVRPRKKKRHRESTHDTILLDGILDALFLDGRERTLLVNQTWNAQDRVSERFRYE